MKKQLFSILITIIFSLNIQAQCTMSVNDSLALDFFYTHFDGDNWIDTTGWTNGPIAGRYGIDTIEVGDSCYVRSIDMFEVAPNGNGLTGELYDFSFPYLEVLELKLDDISGELLDFSGMPNLKTLDFTGLNLSGAVPDFSFMPGLEYLRLDSNNGLVDTLPNFSNLANLKELRFSGTSIVGPLPNLNLPNLEEFVAINNSELNGVIPNLENCQSLVYLDLGFCSLEGPLPDFNLSNLEYLILYHNELTGEIPNFSGLSSIKEIDLDYNQLSGTLPNFTNESLVTIKVVNNQLDGVLPNLDLPDLEELLLSHNGIEGSIPNFNLPSLEKLYVDSNNINGLLPNFNQLQSLERLLINNNQFSGPFPDFNYLPNLIELDVCPGNDFYGAIPNLLNTGVNSADVDWDCIFNADITGQAYWDQDENCELDADEIPIINAFISIDNGYYVLTDEYGYYELGSDTGQHIIDYYPPSFIFQQTCPDDGIVIEVDSLDQIIGGVDFGNEATVECSYLIVDIVSPPLIKCSESTYSVSYCNGGTAIAEEAYVSVKLSTLVEVLDTSIPFNIDNGILRFNLGDLAPGDCGSFTIEVAIECDILEGASICANATIFPHDPCTDPVIWDESDLTVEAYCENDNILFRIFNEGEDMVNSGSWRIYQDDILVSWDNSILILGGDSLDINQSTSGETYRMVVEQSIGNPSLSSPQAIVEGCGGFPFSTGYVTSQMEPDEDPYTEIVCQEIYETLDGYNVSGEQLMPIGEEKVGMYASPKGKWENHFITLDTELEYLIWFELPIAEEEGDSLNIFIVDTLDQLRLDLSSIKIAQSSHPNIVSRQDTNVLTYQMDGIPLSNELQLGYVKFKVRLNPTLEDGLLFNKAFVYYNQVEAIETDLIFHTIGQDPPVSIADTYTGRQQVIIYPNPANRELKLQFTDDSLSESEHRFTIKDIYGNTHQSHIIHHLNQPISTKKLSTGIYFLEIYNDKQELKAVKKLLIQH